MSGHALGRKHRNLSKLHMATIAVVSACSFYAAESSQAANQITVFNAVGALDPNNGVAINVIDAASNATSNFGVSYGTFNTSVASAFAANNGGVCNFGDGGTFVSGQAVGADVNGIANATQVNIGTSGNSFSFYRSDGTNGIGYALNNTAGTTNFLASGGAGNTPGYYLGESGNSSGAVLTFEQGLADFGITLLPRSNGATTSVSFTVNYSNGTSAISSSGTTNSPAVVPTAPANAVFFGFAAPTGTTITSVTINSSTGTATLDRWDDLAFILPTVAAGTPYYWTAATNTSWASPNWSLNPAGTAPGVLPTNGVAAVVFAATSVTSSANLATTLGANQNASSIAVNTSAGAVSIGGTQNLTIGSGGISMVAGGPLTINTTGQVILPGNQTWSSGTSSINVSSRISATGALNIAGSGTVVLSGANTFTGGINVQFGTLQLGNASALGGSSAAVQVNSGTLDLNGNSISVASLGGTGAGAVTSTVAGPATLTVGGTSNTSYGGLITDGAGQLALIKNGTGQLILLGSSTYSGGTTINAGELRGTPSVPGAVSPFGSGPVNLNGALLSLYINANTNVDTYSNTFNLSGGRLASVDGQTHLAGAINVLGNTTLDRTFSGQGVTGATAKQLYLDGVMSGSGNLSLYNVDMGFKEGGYVDVTNSANTYNGTITINSNTGDPATANVSNGLAVVVGASTALQFATVDLEGNGTAVVPFGLQFNAGFGISLGSVTLGALQGTGQISLQDLSANPVTLTVGNNNASTTYSGNLNGSGGITKVGSGVFTLTGTNTYTGTTGLAAGVLIPSASSIPAASTINFTGGTLRHSATNLTDYSSVIQNSSSPISIDTNGQTITYATSLSGSNTGGLTKLGAGTLNLTAAANYSGNTNINNGTLGITSINSNGTVFVNMGGTLTASGSSSVGGLLNVAGGGFVDLRNATVDTLNVNGGLTLTSGSLLGFDVAGANGTDSINLIGGSYSYSFNTSNGTATVYLGHLSGFQAGTYNLITNAPGITANEFSLGSAVSGYRLTLGTADLQGGPSNDTLQLSVVATAPVVEYWHGGRVAGAGTVWNAINGSTTNFDTDQTSNISATGTPSLPTAVIFSANSASPVNEAATTLGADTSVKSIEIQTSNPVGIGGANTLTIDQGVTLDSTAGATTISTSAIILNSDQSWTNNSVNLLSVSASISGVGRSLTIAGSGTTLLSGANTFNGSIGISSGATLSIGNAQSLGQGTLAVNGTLNLNGQTTTLMSSLSGSGTVTNNTAALATLSVGGGTFSGAFQDGAGKTALNLSGGILVLTGTSTATGGTTIGTGATLQLGDGTSFTGAIAGPIVNNGSLSLSGPGPQSIGGNISGVGSVNVNASSTIVLSGSNSYTGTTNANNGTLQLGNSSALGSSSAKLLVNGGTVDLNGFSPTLSSVNGSTGSITSSAGGTTSTLTVAGTTATSSYAATIVDGAGIVAVVVNAGGILTLTNVNNGYSGGTTVNGGGTLNIGDGTTNASATPDNTLGSGPVRIGSATTPIATLTFRDQQGGAGLTLHNFSNSFSVTGNTLIQDAQATNVISGPTSLNGSNNTIGIIFNDKPLEFSGPVSGTGNVTLVGYGKAVISTLFGGGGYIAIGNNTTGSVDNTGFTGTLTENNTLTADNVRGAQILALENAFLPNGTIAFTGDLPVVGIGPVINGFNPYNSSAVTFAQGVTAPQIGALSSSTGGAIALATQAYEGVNLTLGLNNLTGSTYAGNLYDNSKATVNTSSGSLTKVGTNMQILTGTDYYTGGTNVAGGTLWFASPGAFPNFTSLTIGANALATAANHGSSAKNNLFTSSLSIAGTTNLWTGKLDLANNDMVVQNGSLATLTNQVAQGYNNGTWNNTGSNGGGIVSTAAAADSRHLTALGVIQNSTTGLPGGTILYSSFDGATASASTDVLLKYTYYGDTNLDGKVDGSDYSRIDNGYSQLLTGWFNGDFNYDGVVNGSDYTLIDNAFNSQGAQITASIAVQTAEIAGTSAVPEPATLGLLGIGLAGLLGRRPRSR